MRPSKAYPYVSRSQRRQRVLGQLARPLTATQLARRTGLRSDSCRHVLGELSRAGLTLCLNSQARRSRLYGLTDVGIRYRKRIRRDAGTADEPVEFAGIDWGLYGWVCYRHRAAIMKTLSEPLQPSAIKRRARARDSTLRMSANNVRDVIRLFRQRGIVRQVLVRKKKHPRYELTDIGQKIRQVLLAAEAV